MAQPGGGKTENPLLKEQQDVHRGSLQEVFQDSTVLLTGVTGPLGSLVLEKLLRSCSGVAKVFVTIRGKHGKSAAQRLQEVFSTKIFHQVRLDHKDAFKKVELLDLDLGLERHVCSVTYSVTMVIHCAVVTDPEHTLRDSVEANIKFTKGMLQLAHLCPALEAFVVVSSTAAHIHEAEVEERFYLPALICQGMIMVCDSLPEHTLNSADGLVVDRSPASTVTLGIMEHHIQHNSRSLPVALVRPSTLVPSFKEPLAGWLPHAPGGLMRLLTQAMQGRLCTLRCDSSLTAEVMPTDLAASLVLAVTGHTATVRRKSVNNEECSHDTKEDEVPIYNLVSSTQSPVSMGEFFTGALEQTRSAPLLKTSWYPHLVLFKSKILFWIWFHILQLVPALVVDTYYSLTGNTTCNKQYRLYRSLLHTCETLPMMSQKYRDNNTQALWRSLSHSDRITFNFQAAQLDWTKYLHTLTRGVKLYCLEEDTDTIPLSLTNIKRLKFLHYFCSAVFLILTCFVFFTIVKFLMV